MLNETSKNCLREYLKSKPLIFSAIRTVECEYFSRLNLESPILDLGCGDGFFTSVCFPDQKMDVGLEPWNKEYQKALKLNKYKILCKTNSDTIPFPEGHFKSIIANCVIEHIDNDEGAIKEISRVLGKGGKFAFGVPSVFYEEMLKGGKVFGNAYKKFFTRIARHKHYRSLTEWNKILTDNNLRIISSSYYIDQQTLTENEKNHYLEFPRLGLNTLLNRYFFSPQRHLTKNYKKYLEMVERNLSHKLEKGACLFIVAEKI